MGQKTNPNIFRISKTNDWKSKYTEKKWNEFSLYTGKDLEIKKFIIKFFKNHGLLVHSCQLNYSNNALTINVAYQQSSNSTFLLSELNKSQKIKFVKNKIDSKGIPQKTYNSILKTIKNQCDYGNIIYKTNLKKSQYKYALNKVKIQSKRSKALKYYKKYLQLTASKDFNTLNSNTFINKLLKSISQFWQEKIKITLILTPLNNHIKTNLTKKQHKLLRKKVVQLRKYQRNEFFREGVNLIFSSVNLRDSANLISEFISQNLRKLKRHNFFLKFIKNILSIFISKTFSSKIKGVKIKIKGRFNGAPRAKSKILQIGKHMPVLTLNAKISYSETTAYTANGTFGVKVWVCENHK
jgi:hypothetical protein